MSADLVTSIVPAITPLVLLGPLSVGSIMPVAPPPAAMDSTSTRLVAEAPHRSIHLVDRVIDGSDFDAFRDRLWQAIQQRDTTFILTVLPEEGIFVGQEGPIPADLLVLEDAASPFWQSLEKMLAPKSCELEDYPGTLPDAAVWGCPNIASALRSNPDATPAARPSETSAPVVILGQRVNVRVLPRLGTSIVGSLSNEVVEFDHTVWQELMQTAPETTDDPIDGWTPVILPNQVQGYVYNRYVYHPQGPRALFELIDGQWKLVRIVVETESEEF